MYPEIVAVQVARAALRSKPTTDGPLETQVLFGERVTVHDVVDGYAQVITTEDKYPGWISSGVLLTQADTLERTPTHRVCVPRAVVREEMNWKYPPIMHLDLNALVAVRDEYSGFARLEGAGWVPRNTLARIGEPAEDWVAVAQMFLGAQYLWGGRTLDGIDCSGLVQSALLAGGIPCPRNSGDIEQSVGRTLKDSPSLIGLARGDLVFWKGHVGIMVDPTRILHATKTLMRVELEPIGTVAERRKQEGDGGITSIKRLG
jgi:cell wall-associated NlpC family hydrolase